MSTPYIPTDRADPAVSLLRPIWLIARLAGHAIRLTLLATLLAFEPLIRLLLSSIAVVGILVALFFECLIRLPHFPFWLMVGISVGSAALLVPYYALIGALEGQA